MVANAVKPRPPDEKPVTPRQTLTAESDSPAVAHGHGNGPTRDPDRTAAPATEPAVGTSLFDRGYPAEVEVAPATDLPLRDRQRYEFGDEHARGGLGKIMLARDRELDRQVAVKELLNQGNTSRARFVREAMITARLEHPGIVPVHEAGRWSTGEPFYAMKLVSGRPLGEVIIEARTLGERLALLPDVIAVADAIAYAHSRFVIHRDLKPSNVMVGAYGETVVIDWGLAKDLSRPDEAADLLAGPYRTAAEDGLTTVGAVIGTPAYMPPEQAEGLPVDERADVYSIGAILYHLLSGQMPYGDTKPKGESSLLDTVKQCAPTRLAEVEADIPADLLTIVDKAMARDASDRYSSAGALVEDLRRYQTGQLVGAHRYSTWALVKRWVGRHRGAVAMAAVMVLLLAAGGAVSFWRIADERDRAREQRAVAQRQERIADENRSEVEGLLEFMLSDLRDNLEPIGKLDLLDMVAGKASAYYKQRPVDWSHPDQARKRAVAHNNVGYVLHAQGDLAGALAEHRAGKAIVERLVELDPGNVEWRHDLAASHKRLGKLLETEGELAAALAEYQAGKALAERLVELDPEHAQWQLILSLSHLGIGNVLRAQGDLAGALAQHRAQKAIAERLVELEPRSVDWQRELSMAHAEVGNVLFDQYDFPGALAEFRAQKAIAERLVEIDQKNARWQYDLARSHGRVGSVLLRWQSDRAGALAEYQASKVILARLVENDPDNALWRRAVAVMQGKVGDVLASQSDLAGALAEYRASKAMREALVEIDPQNTEWQRDLVVIHNRLGRALEAQGDLAGALAEYRAFVPIAERLVAQDPQNARWQNDLAFANTFLGDALRRMGKPSAAREHLARGAGIYERKAVSAADFYGGACAFALIEEADKAFEMLDKAIDQGWKDVAWAEKDDSLASLRKDPRWKPLLERMRGKE